jgi:hypothetical protein
MLNITAPVEERLDIGLDYRLRSRLAEYGNIGDGYWIQVQVGFGKEKVQESRGRVRSAVVSRYQKTGEEMADLKDSVRAVVNCTTCELANCNK